MSRRSVSRRSRFPNEPPPKTAGVRGSESESTGETEIEHRVKFRVTPKDGIRPGRSSYSVRFTTNDERVPEMSVPVSANVLGDIQAQPRNLLLGQLTPGENLTKTFTIASKSQSPFEIVSIQVDGALSNARAEVEPVVLLTPPADQTQPEAGADDQAEPQTRADAYKVTITFAALDTVRQTGSIRVITSMKDEPAIIVPYNGWVRGAAARPSTRPGNRPVIRSRQRAIAPGQRVQPAPAQPAPAQPAQPATPNNEKDQG